MKVTLRTSILALLVSIAFGYFIAYFSIPRPTESTRTTLSSALPESKELESLKKQKALLEATILSLEEENQNLQERCKDFENANESDVDRAVAIQSLKDQWIQEIIDQSGPDTGQNFQSELARFQQRFHLTADQMLQLEPLLRKREQFSKLIMLRRLGLMSEEEFNSQISAQKEFNFDQAVTNLLSDEQKKLFLERQETQQDRGLNVAAYAFAERYNFTNPERFSSEQQTTIQGLFKEALAAAPDMEIPPSIQALDIDIIEKRMLSLGYKELDDETFKKMYEALVEYHENDNP